MNKVCGYIKAIQDCDLYGRKRTAYIRCEKPVTVSCFDTVKFTNRDYCFECSEHSKQEKHNKYNRDCIYSSMPSKRIHPDKRYIFKNIQ